MLSEGMVNDRTMSLARLALLYDEMNVPQLSGRRKIFVWTDQRIEVNGRTSQMSFQITSTEVQGKDALALIAAAAKGTATHIEGVGTIRTVL